MKTYTFGHTAKLANVRPNTLKKFIAENKIIPEIRQNKQFFDEEDILKINELVLERNKLHMEN